MIKIYDKFKGIGRYRKLSDKVKQFISSDEFPKTIKLSKKVKELIYIDKLRDSHGGTLLKYSHTVQNKLADTMIKHKIPTHKAQEFCKLYDANPKRNLDDIANEVNQLKDTHNRSVYMIMY